MDMSFASMYILPPVFMSRHDESVGLVYHSQGRLYVRTVWPDRGPVSVCSGLGDWLLKIRCVLAC